MVSKSRSFQSDADKELFFIEQTNFLKSIIINFLNQTKFFHQKNIILVEKKIENFLKSPNPLKYEKIDNNSFQNTLKTLRNYSNNDFSENIEKEEKLTGKVNNFVKEIYQRESQIKGEIFENQKKLSPKNLAKEFDRTEKSAKLSDLFDFKKRQRKEIEKTRSHVHFKFFHN